MMATCENTSIIFPMLADIYYPIVDQGAYGNVKKNWIHDRTIACNFNSAGTAWKEDIRPNANITQDSVMLGRVRTDIRFSNEDTQNSITNIIVTNIKDKNLNEIYVETSGPRAGKSTLFEVATIEPFLGPFGSVEYYKVIVRRSENQAADL
jgi:hypothetical protein